MSRSRLLGSSKYFSLETPRKIVERTQVTVDKNSKEHDKVSINKKQFKEWLQNLKTQSDVPTTKLSSEYEEEFKLVKEHLRVIYGTDAFTYYNEIIKETFSNVNSVPGTVAAFFAGCCTDENFTGPKMCAPKCSSSLDPNDAEGCPVAVFVYQNRSLKKLNNRISSQAYVHVMDPNFKTFSSKQISDLKDYGITHLSLTTQNSDGNFGINSEMQSIEFVPQQTGGSGMSTGAWVGIGIAIVVIIILLVVLGFYLYDGNKPKTSFA